MAPLRRLLSVLTILLLTAALTSTTGAAASHRSAQQSAQDWTKCKGYLGTWKRLKFTSHATGTTCKKTAFIRDIAYDDLTTDRKRLRSRKWRGTFSTGDGAWTVRCKFRKKPARRTGRFNCTLSDYDTGALVGGIKGRGRIPKCRKSTFGGMPSVHCTP